MSNTTPTNESLQNQLVANPMDLMEKLTQLTQAITLQQTQMLELHNAALNKPQQTPHATEGVISPNPIDVKMDGTNYTFWCQAVEMYVRGRDKMHHLTGAPAPPKPTDPEYHRWDVNDVIVKGWLINSLEPRLKSKYIRHPTARDVWQALATTFYDGSDEAQVFDLNRRVSRIKQGGRAVDMYYDELHGLWQEIDYRSPNQMECARDIEKFNLFIQKTRVYTFLDGLDDSLDAMRAQVVHMTPFPSLEQAYAFIRREANRQSIMLKSGREPVQNSVAMATHGYTQTREGSTSNNKFGNNLDKSKLKCSHCGRTRHLRNQCFEIVGYPEWWKDRKKRQGEGNKGRSNMAAAGDNQTEKAQAEPSVPEELVLATGGLAAATQHGSGEVMGSSSQGKNSKLNSGNCYLSTSNSGAQNLGTDDCFKNWIID